MGMLFAFFFLGSPLVALVIVPWLRLTGGARFRDRVTHVLYRGMWLIARTARFFGVVGLDLPPPPAAIDRDEPYVLISNHPTYIDMIVILGTFEELTCVTNGRWWRHWALGRLLKATNYLPGPGSGLPESEDVLLAMVDQLKKGHALLVFPEGQRSLATQLRRFRRGAVEAAVRADVPIAPLFLAIDRPYLTKTVSIWRPPSRPPTYRFDWMAPIRPADFGHDARKIHEHLTSLYEARFAEQLALQERLEPTHLQKS
jgi:1-acyl-sn-glycerol-3-phosphate acyltransferase